MNLFDTIKLFIIFLVNFKIANEETANNLAKSINIINKNNSDISKKLSDIKSIVTTNRNNNANTLF